MKCVIIENLIWDRDKGCRYYSLYQVVPYCVKTYILLFVDLTNVNMKPYTCEGHLQCEYSNKCLAKAVEYDVIHEYKPRNIHRKPKGKCGNIIMSYICGYQKCEYKNKGMGCKVIYRKNTDIVGYIKNGKFKSTNTKIYSFLTILSTIEPK